ncbi:hypothetical protein Tco_0098622 [Tanacetum coccineum]
MECSSRGALYNKSCGCSKGGLVDKFVRDPNKTPDLSQRPSILYAKCGNPVEGPSCQGCALWRKKLKEVWFATCHENGINQDLLNTSESPDDDTNVKERRKTRIAKSKRLKIVIEDSQFATDDDDDLYHCNHTRLTNQGAPFNSLSMGDEHLSTISETESDEVIKSSVENLVPIPNTNNDSSSSDDDSYENIDYIDASPPDDEIVSLEVKRILSLLMTIILRKVVWQFPLIMLIILKYENLASSLIFNQFYFLPVGEVILIKEFADELAHIISPPEYDCFCFKIEPELGNLTMDVVEDIFPTREPEVLSPDFWKLSCSWYLSFDHRASKSQSSFGNHDFPIL